MSKVNILQETVRGYQCINIEDAMLQQRKIFFTETATSESCNELFKQLMYLESQDNTSEITIYINSPGGEVESGLAVYDYIKLMKSPIRTVCTGMAASMAAVLFLVGDKREMFEHTKIMIHDPSYGGGNLAGVKPMQIKEKLDNIMKTRDMIAKIISDRTGIQLEDVYKMTEKDCFLDAKESVKLGIATKIIDSI